MKHFFTQFISLLLFVLIFTSLSIAQENEPEIEKLSESEYRVGSAILNTVSRSVTVTGFVNMSEGMIELLACGPKGKRHESVLVLDVAPYHLQVSLLMLGLTPGKGVSFLGDPAIPEGDSLSIYVSWSGSDGNDVRVRAEELVNNLREKKPMQETAWVFTGSRFSGGRFLAALEESYVTTFHDPNTIIDSPLSTGADDTLYEVNTTKVPPVNTPVKVEFIAQ